MEDLEPAQALPLDPNSPHLRARDLLASFEPDGLLLVRSSARGVAAELDAAAIAVLSACTQPLSCTEIANHFGPEGADLYAQLVDLELLVPPAQAHDTPVLFGNFAGIDVHRAMLSDRARVQGYYQAIRQVVRPGDVVIDAGTGTGLLAVMAAQAGARRVYAIERTEFARVARQVAIDNGCADRIEVLEGDFGQLELPERARVLVTETFGAWVLAEGAIPDLIACAAANLEPDGICIPTGYRLFLSPMHQAPPTLLQPFCSPVAGVNLSSLRSDALGRAELRAVSGPEVGDAQLVARFGLLEDPHAETLELHIQGPCEALCAWFELELTPELLLSTAPSQPLTSWKHAVLPIALPPGSHRLQLTLEPAPEDRRTLLVEFELVELEGAVRRSIRLR